MSLSGKVCLVVGASGAIGSSVAGRLARGGATLGLTYRSNPLSALQSDLAAIGSRFENYRLDVCRIDDVKEVIESVEQELGPIEVLVNCSGMYGPIGPTHEVAPNEWANAIQLNLIGAFNLVREVVPKMIPRQSGKIIHFSGGGAAYGRPYFTAYGASKAALVRFTESLSEELRDSNIQVNAIAPGPVKSRLWEELRANLHSAGTKAESELKMMDDTGGVSADRAAELAFMLATATNGVTGRLISAVHDDWEHLDRYAEKLAGSDAWTLRRISLQ